MNEEKLIKYYNKFNEDKRLTTKHGMIEFKTSIKYILEYLNKMDNPKIIDIGAGTGKYSLALDKLGYDVSAIELVKHNLKVLESKNSNVKTYLGNAIDLSKFKDNSFDLVILFGPMYHLINIEDKIKALNETKRIVKKSGYIFISYCMNEYAIITHGFIENEIINSFKENKIDSNFHIISTEEDLYSYVRMEDIDYLKKKCNLKRNKILSQDGPTEYLKKVLNQMNDQELDLFYKYHLSTCENKYLLGAGRHILDILQK